MGSRLELHNELLKFADNVYYQPPSNIKLKYPCIVYDKRGKARRYGNNDLYLQKQQYNLTLMGFDVDEDVEDLVEEYFEHCVITQYMTVDNVYQVVLSLYY